MSTEKKYCDYTVDERGVALMAVNNPPMNTLSQGVLADIKDAIKRANADPAVRAVVFTGEGKAFIAGADINEFVPKNTKKDGASYLENGQEMTNLIENSDKPYIAAINGYCLGGGLELAMACHIRICSDRARLGQTEVSLGLIPGWGGTQRLTRLVGKGKALEVILTADMITAQEAYRIGLVNKVVPSGAVLKEARDLARKIAGRSRLPIAAVLRAVFAGSQVPLEDGLRIEGEQFVGEQGGQTYAVGFRRHRRAPDQLHARRRGRPLPARRAAASPRTVSRRLAPRRSARHLPRLRPRVRRHPRPRRHCVT